jgi:hypothetical protein
MRGHFDYDYGESWPPSTHSPTASTPSSYPPAATAVVAATGLETAATVLISIVVVILIVGAAITINVVSTKIHGFQTSAEKKLVKRNPCSVFSIRGFYSPIQYDRVIYRLQNSWSGRRDQASGR